MNKWRIAEVYKGNKWQKVPRCDIKIFDKFSLYEPDGTQVLDKNGNGEWVASSDAIPIEPTGNYSVSVFQLTASNF